MTVLKERYKGPPMVYLVQIETCGMHAMCQTRMMLALIFPWVYIYVLKDARPLPMMQTFWGCQDIFDRSSCQRCTYIAMASMDIVHARGYSQSLGTDVTRRLLWHLMPSWRVDTHS